jgi:hypothetical protein
VWEAEWHGGYREHSEEAKAQSCSRAASGREAGIGRSGDQRRPEKPTTTRVLGVIGEREGLRE